YHDRELVRRRLHAGDGTEVPHAAVVAGVLENKEAAESPSLAVAGEGLSAASCSVAPFGRCRGRPRGAVIPARIAAATAAPRAAPIPACFRSDGLAPAAPARGGHPAPLWPRPRPLGWRAPASAAGLWRSACGSPCRRAPACPLIR